MRKVALALIEKEGKFLLINRQKPHLKLSWAFPGGMIEDGESEEKAVIREVKEEVNMDVQVVKKLLSRKHPNTFVELVYFHCVPTSDSEPKVMEDYEIKEVKWVPAQEVLSYFTSDIDPIIMQGINIL